MSGYLWDQLYDDKLALGTQITCVRVQDDKVQPCVAIRVLWLTLVLLTRGTRECITRHGSPCPFFRGVV